MSFLLKKKSLKKIISSITMLTTVIAFSGVMALSSVALAVDAIADGALIKSNATNTDGTPTFESLDVYIVKVVAVGDGEAKLFKRLILNPTVYESYEHLSWDDIQTVSQDVMDLYTTSALVRVATDPAEKVFAMAPDGDIGAKAWVNLTTEEATSVTGYDADSVYTINAVDGASYTTGTDITTVAELTTFYANGTLPEGEVTPVPTGSDLAVALSAATTASMNTYTGSTVKFASINVTAGDEDAVVTGMKVKRSGVGSYADFASVWLVVDGTRRGSVKSLNSADEANLLFSADTNKVTVTSGSTKTFELFASMATSGTTAGDQNELGITEMSTTATVSGLPVYGNTMNMSAVAAPDVTIDEATIGNTANVGDTNVVVAKFKIDNDETSETAVFEAITFKAVTLSGQTRAYTSDFTNFRLYDNAGNIVAGPVEMGSDNYLRFTLDDAFVVPAGTSKLEWFTVQADVVDGAGRTLNLSLEGAYDVAVHGGTNLIRSAVTNSYTDANEYVTLAASDLSISADITNNPIAASVNENSTVVLMKGNLTAAKGAVNADGLTVTLTGTDMDFVATAEFDNLRVFIDNLLVSEAATASISTADGETSILVAFTDAFTVDGIVPVRVEIDVLDLRSGDTGTVIQATIAGSSITGSTVADGAAVTGTGSAAGNNQTVAIPGYKIYKSATPVTLSKVVGSQDAEFLGMEIKANNTIPVIVNKIKIQLTGSDDITAGQNDVQNIELVDVNGTVIAGPVNLNSSLEYEFTGLNLTVNSNGTKLIVRGDIASSLTDTDYDTDGTAGLWFAVISSEGTANNNNYSGANSAGVTLADGVAEVNTAVGTIININAGSLTVTLGVDTATSSQLVALSTDNAIASWKLLATNEDVQVKKFRVGLTTGPAGEDEISRIGLYEGTTLLAETYSFSGGYTNFDITDKNFVVTAGAGNARYLTMRVDLTSTTNTVLDSGATVAGVLIDVEASGNSELAPISGSTADGFAFATSTKSTGAAMTNTTGTQVTIVTGSGILAGDVIRINDEQMYATSWEIGDTVLNVVRGFNGTVAATHSTQLVYVARTIEGNNNVAYGAKVVVTEGDLASGSLEVGTSYWTAFKFKVTPSTNSVNDATLESVKISLAQSTGIGATATSDYFIASMALYNGAGALISEFTHSGAVATDGACGATGADEQLCVSTDYIVFNEATETLKNTATGAGLAEPIAATGETFTVKVKVTNAVTTNDTLKLQIADLGTIAAAGGISWSDSIITTPFITWVGDGVNESIVGPQFMN